MLPHRPLAEGGGSRRKKFNKSYVAKFVGRGGRGWNSKSSKMLRRHSKHQEEKKETERGHQGKLSADTSHNPPLPKHRRNVIRKRRECW